MIYLDANAFYWYLGRNEIEMSSSIPILDVDKLKAHLDLHLNKSLAASAFMEMIVHFRDKPDFIKKIISFREEKGLKIYNNFREHVFTPDELLCIRMTTDNNLLKCYAYKLLNEKIDVEVKHSYVFLQVVSLLYADYYLKSCPTIDNDVKEKVLLYIGKDISNQLKDDYISQLKSALSIGYEIDKTEQTLKEKYIELLVQNCTIFHMIVDAMVGFLNNDDDLYKVMCDSAKKARNDGFNNDEIMKTIVRALEKDSTFLQYAKKEIADRFYRKGYSRHQSDYIQVMMEAWLERGQKLRKNDIFDMLYVGSIDKKVTDFTKTVLDNQNTYLITFDKVLMKFVCKNEYNKILLNKFLLPKHQQ